MAISFIEKGKSKFEKRQRNLLFILGILIGLFIFLLINQGYLGKIFSLPKKQEISEPFKKIEIDFSILENPVLQKLKKIEKVEPFQIEKPKENPFSI